MKKTLCLLLSAILLMSAMPFVALGAGTINLVDIIGLVAPAENAEPNWYITDSDPDYEVVYVEWFENESETEMPLGSKFKAGNSYTVVIWIETQNNYVFRTSNINGELTVTVTNNGESIDSYLLSGSNEQMKVSIEYPPFESKLISEVAITGIDRPVAGMIPDYTAEADSESYKIDDQGICSVEWYDITEGEGASEMPHDEVFIAGHKYRVCVWLRAINGYSFITDEDVAVKINGEQGKHLSENSIVAYVCYDFDSASELGNPAVKFTSTENSVTLSWNKVDGATDYRIFVAQGGKWVQAVKATGALKYTFKNLTAGTKYTYAVRAYLNTGSKIIWAPKFTSVVTATQPAVLPKVTSTKQTATAVTLTWDKVAATGYRVFRYNPSTKTWDIAVKATSATTVTLSGLKEGTNYIFAVRPYINTGSQIVWAKAYTKVTTSTMLSAVTLKVASTATGRATIAWGKAAGATGYQVYYSTNASSGYKKLGNFTNNSTYQYKLTSGTNYYYRVRAYKVIGGAYVYGAWSPVVSVKIK